MYIYHNFFIHTSVDGHLGCFCVLAIVNSAAINIRVHVSFSILVFFFFNKYILQYYTIDSRLNLWVWNCGYGGPIVKLYLIFFFYI